MPAISIQIGNVTLLYLRLDIRENAIAKLDDIFPIIPGKPDDSEVWKRITTKDEDDVMPPKKQ
ncbi:MAG: hypothetical protein NTX56_11520, partial [Proteobacteria bacterium]|nr:hypothetical protein [Pseudomonadota bacterium]